MLTVARNWKYQSYRPEPGALAADPTNPIFICWSPPGLGVVTVDDGGATGTLEFKGTPIKLKLKFHVTEGNPRRVSIAAAMDLPTGGQFTNELQGWFVPATLGSTVDENTKFVVRGSIVQTSADIAKVNPQPIFTAGFFVLEPVE